MHMLLQQSKTLKTVPFAVRTFNRSQMSSLDLGNAAQLSDKKALRKQLNHVLSSMSTDQIQHESTVATNLLLSLSEYKNARSISIFMSMPKGEIMTDRVVKHALSSGKSVFVPYIHKPKQPNHDKVPASMMDMLQLASEDDYNSLQPDRWGIPSIPKDTVSERANAFGGQGVTNGQGPAPDSPGLDVIVVPCMAFDQDLNRLGHGKGYYDNFLTRYCSGKTTEGQSRKKPFLVGFALAQQLLPLGYRLPTDAWDWRVDAVVVGEGGSEARLVTG